MDLEQVPEFIDQLLTRLTLLGIDTTELPVDHFGFYTRNSQAYEREKAAAEGFAKLKVESVVGGRRVGVFALNEPIIAAGQDVRAFEIIEPKPDEQVDSDYLEHIELVIDQGFAEFADSYPDINWDRSKIDREQFPMLKLPLEGGFQVKFRHGHILEE